MAANSPKQLSDLQAMTRVYLMEATQADWLDTEVLYAINLGYQDIAGSIMEVYEWFYETLNPFTYAIVANQQEYAIDKTLIKVTRVEINYSNGVSGSVATRCVPIKMDEIRLNLSNKSGNFSYFNAGYYLHGNIATQQIGFIPIPTTSDTGSTQSISVWGIQMPADLVNTTDAVNVPYSDRFAYLICLKAAAILLRKGQQEEAAASRYLLEYESGRREMQAFIKERQADDIWMVEDAILEDLDFSTNAPY